MDAALAESSLSFTARIRERERRLLNETQGMLEKIDEGIYGECESCSEEIEVERLLARPVASLCIEGKGEQERLERQGE
jgi:DnaK suppressor protein